MSFDTERVFMVRVEPFTRMAEVEVTLGEIDAPIAPLRMMLRSGWTVMFSTHLPFI